MDERKKVEEVKKRYESLLLSKRGVVACYTGRKKVHGQETDTWAIVCLVQKKLRSQIAEEDFIPPEIEGVPTDVIESGKLKAL